MFIPGWREGQGLPTRLYPVSLCQSEGYEDISVRQRKVLLSHNFFHFPLGWWEVKRTLLILLVRRFLCLNQHNTKKTKSELKKSYIKNSQLKVMYIFFQMINRRVHIMLRSKHNFSFHSDLTVCLGMVCFAFRSSRSKIGGVHHIHEKKWVWETCWTQKGDKRIVCWQRRGGYEKNLRNAEKA